MTNNANWEKQNSMVENEDKEKDTVVAMVPENEDTDTTNSTDDNQVVVTDVTSDEPTSEESIDENPESEDSGVDGETEDENDASDENEPDGESEEIEPDSASETSDKEKMSLKETWTFGSYRSFTCRIIDCPYRLLGWCSKKV